MIAPFSELWDRSQGSSARSSTPSTASDLQPCRDAQGSMVRGYRWPVARLRFDTHVMARFLTRNSAGSTVLTWVWIEPRHLKTEKKRLLNRNYRKPGPSDLYIGRDAFRSTRALFGAVFGVP